MSRIVSDDHSPGIVAMIFDGGWETMMLVARAVESAARAGVSFAIAAVFGAGVYASAFGLPLKDVFDPHAIRVMITITGVGLGVGFIRGLSQFVFYRPQIVSAARQISPMTVEPDAG
jgi:hypothetical protein